MALRSRKGKRRTGRFGIASGKHSTARHLVQTYKTSAKQARKRYKMSHVTGQKWRIVLGRVRVVAAPVFSTDSYWLINLDLLQGHVGDITRHSILCEKARELASAGHSPVKLVSEVRRMGLASVLMAQCQGCSQTFRFETSKKVESSSGNRRFDVNIRAVWGNMATGGGVAHLNETMATLNAPGMSQKTFSAIEEEVSQWWQSVLEEDLITAGTEERELAIARGDYHQGIPAITVICDGGWSKRAHKHTYNAAGGVAVIIGACTKKLLHIGVRNKNCYICTRAETLNRPPLEHTCFRNWKESSQAMEADIIVEGFKKSEGMHGVRYMRVIADGDSSVYARIQEQVAGWGCDVKKLECSNHVCKCLRSSLENLVNEKPHYKGKNKLTQRTRVRLTSAVRCAIKMRSAENIARQSTLKKLRHDIKNSVYHIYGDHRNCSDFCHARTDPAAAAREAGEAEKASTTEDDGIVPEVLGQQHDYWTQGSDDAALKESRLSGELKSDDLDSSLLRDISLLLERVVNKADRLLGNFTSNLAECWMSVRAKFDGGKVINRCNRGSWHARCFGSALQYNQGSMWSPQTWETVSGTPAGVHFTALFDNRQRQTTIRRRAQSQPRYRSLRWKRKIAAASKCRTKKARMEYGPQAVEVVPDCSPEELKEATDLFLSKHINLGEVNFKESPTVPRTNTSAALGRSNAERD